MIVGAEAELLKFHQKYGRIHPSCLRNFVAHEKKMSQKGAVVVTEILESSWNSTRFKLPPFFLTTDRLFLYIVWLYSQLIKIYVPLATRKWIKIGAFYIKMWLLHWNHSHRITFNSECQAMTSILFTLLGQMPKCCLKMQIKHQKKVN